uniref:Uncharacterized protein n=1 Tax=Nelumbo nucifera TaxID=4432 RepID=A0A822YT94_NELNU|nr:TPA_asm: hypothetical protein HUJ06_006360 [Nelumbo nucifera]
MDFLGHPPHKRGNQHSTAVDSSRGRPCISQSQLDSRVLLGMFEQELQQLAIDFGQLEAVTRRILWIKSTDPKAKVLVFSSWNDVLDVLELGTCFGF